MKVQRVISTMLVILGLVPVMTPAEATVAGTNGRIAWSRDGDIFTMRPDGSGRMRLTDSARWESAHWSPDGMTLAVVQARAKMEQRYRIILMTARGADKTLLARARYSVQGLTWSPDGTKIAYTDLDMDNPDAPAPYPMAIKVIDIATGVQSRLTEFEVRAGSPSWSPDGSRIAYVSSDPVDPNVYPTDTDIHVMDADGSNVQPVVNDDASRAFDPTWSPTGDKIAFIVPIDDPEFGEVSNQVWVVSPDGSGLMALTSRAAVSDRQPMWSPDGTKLSVYRTSSDFKTRLAVIDADGTGEQTLSLMEGAWPAWSPDSTKIAFERRGNLFTVDTNGEGLTKLVGNADRYDGAPSWQARQVSTP